MLPNPWYYLPGSACVSIVPGSQENPIIFQNNYIHIPNTGIQLFFRKNEVAFVFSGSSQDERYLINPIVYYLSYRGFVDLNVFYSGIRENIDTLEFPASHEIIINLSEIKKINEGSSTHFDHNCTQIPIQTKELVAFIDVLDFSLYYALTFYLIGSKNQRYFLIEYYKAVESIMKNLGGKTKGIKILKPFGLDKSLFSDFGRISNDAREAPVDIGRHAPEPNVELFSIDLRNILSEPRSLEIFETGVSCCRQVIDSYLKYRISAKKSENKAQQIN